MIASALKPQYSNPIETIGDIVQNPLPWKYSLQNSWAEYHMKGSTDPLIKNFWTEISFVPLEPFPYNEVQYTSTGWRLPT